MTAVPAGIGHNQPPEPTLQESLAEAHAEVIAKVFAFADDLDAAAPETVKDAADLAAVGKVVVKSRAVFRAIEAARDDAGRPHLEAQRAINAWFGDLKDRVTKLVAPLNEAANAYTAEQTRLARQRAAEDARIQREEAAARAREAEAARIAGDAAREREATAASNTASAAAATAGAVAAARPADLTRTRSAGVTASAKAVFDFAVEDYDLIPLDTLRPYLNVDAIHAAIRQHVRFNDDRKPLAGVRIFEKVTANFR